MYNAHNKIAFGRVLIRRKALIAPIFHLLDVFKANACTGTLPERCQGKIRKSKHCVPFLKFNYVFNYEMPSVCALQTEFNKRTPLQD